jgi:transketolase
MWRDRVLSLMKLTAGDEKHDWSSLSTVDALVALYGGVLRVDPQNPEWEYRDRFILGKGHGPTAYYLCLPRPASSRRRRSVPFMQWKSPLGAHPDRHLVPGLEASTGSLGHGLSIAVGVALALRAKGLTEPRVVCLTGDAELNEGSNWEAILLAPT